MFWYGFEIKLKEIDSWIPTNEFDYGVTRRRIAKANKISWVEMDLIFFKLNLNEIDIWKIN